MSGDLSNAASRYDAVLSEQPNNRDALLGKAALAIRQQHPEQAAAIYSKLLDLNPSDPEAGAALIGMRGDGSDQSESELKTILTRNPKSDASLFRLGNLYLQQSRWSEAEEMFFHAYEMAPGNADYAYNLAISLDRLGQNRLALNYYQQASQLAQRSPNLINQNAIRQRIQQLQQLPLQ